MLQLEALMATEEGNGERATRAILSSFGVGRSLRDEPLNISQLLRNALEGMTLRCLEGVLNRIHLRDQDLLWIAASLEEAVNSRSLDRAYVGEISMTVDAFTWYFQHYEQFVPYVKPPKWRLWWYRFSGQCDLDCAYSLHVIENIIEAQKLSWPKCLEKMRGIQDKLNDLPGTRIVARIFLGNQPQATFKEAMMVARLRAAIVTLAVERFRLANGKLPDKLADLVPKYLDAVPLDPFDGKPLRYRKLKKGFCVYSIGENKTDDGGLEEDPSGGPPDITFTIKR